MATLSFSLDIQPPAVFPEAGTLGRWMARNIVTSPVRLIPNDITGQPDLILKSPTVPPYSSGELNLDGHFGGNITLASPASLTAFSSIAIVKQTSTGGVPGYLSESGNYNRFTTFMCNTGHQMVAFAGAERGQASLGDYVGRGYMTAVHRYDGATFRSGYGAADSLCFKDGASLSATVQNLLVGGVDSEGNTANHKLAAFALWDRYLSDSELQAARRYLLTQVAQDGIAEGSGVLHHIILGDSITDSTANPRSYVRGFYATGDNTKKYVGYLHAISGSVLVPTKTSRLADYLKMIETAKGKTVFSSFYSNDLSSMTNQTLADTWLASAQGFFGALLNAGAQVVMCTFLPILGASSAVRAYLNNTIRNNWVGTYCDVIADFGAESHMGPDAAVSDTSLYIDGQHPTQVGHDYLQPVFTAAINSL